MAKVEGGAVKSSEISVNESRDLGQGAGDNGALDAQGTSGAAPSPLKRRSPKLKLVVDNDTPQLSPGYLRWLKKKRPSKRPKPVARVKAQRPKRVPAPKLKLVDNDAPLFFTTSELLARWRDGRRWPSRVYFIKCGEFVKIGVSSDPLKQLRNLRIGNPFELELLNHIPGNEALESALHEKFADLHHRYEWFHFRGELREWIEAETRAAA